MPNPSVKKVCRVCGKEYNACRSSRRGNTTFRWQDVACSQECGAIYLMKIKSKRAPISKSKGIAENNFDDIIEEFDEEDDELNAFFGNSEDTEDE